MIYKNETPTLESEQSVELIDTEKEEIQAFQRQINNRMENLKLYIDNLYENQRFNPKMIVDINERINRIVEFCKLENIKSIFNKYPKFYKSMHELKGCLEIFHEELLLKPIKDTSTLINKYKEFKTKNNMVFTTFMIQLQDLNKNIDPKN